MKQDWTTRAITFSLGSSPGRKRNHLAFPAESADFLQAPTKASRAIVTTCEACGAETVCDKAHIIHGGMGGKASSRANKGNGCDCPCNILFLCRPHHSMMGGVGWSGLMEWIKKYREEWRYKLMQTKLSRARAHFEARERGEKLPCNSSLKRAWLATHRRKTDPHFLVDQKERSLE